MPREQQYGHGEYSPFMRMDFDKRIRRRQVPKLKNINIAIENREEAVKYFIKSYERMYPTTHGDDTTPVRNPRTMTTADLLFHQGQDTTTVQAAEGAPPGSK